MTVKNLSIRINDILTPFIKNEDTRLSLRIEIMQAIMEEIIENKETNT